MIRIERTITIGNIITIASLALLLAVAWTRTEDKISNLETVMAGQQKIAAQQNDAIQELRVVTVRLATLAEVYIPKINAIENQVLERGRKP